MVKSERLPRDLAALNQQLLLIARDVAEHNPTQAAVQFGLDPKTVEALPLMDAGAIVRLAQMPVLMFAPRIPAELMEQAIAAAANEDEGVLRAISDSIVLRKN